MKVCLLNDSFPPVIDGVANVVMNYAKIMQEKEKAQVIVGTPEYPGADYNCYPYKVIPYKSFDTTKIVNGYRTGNPFDMNELIDMKKFEPDIVHTHCPFSSTVMARLLRAGGKTPIIFTYHTKFDVDIAKAVKTKFIQNETIKALVSNVETCDEVWVVSEGAGKNLKSLGYTGDYRVMNNGVDFPKGRAKQSEVIDATRGYDLPEHLPVFLFVGRMVKYKGIPLIIEALSKLKQAGCEFRMVFVGGGPDEAEIKQQARECDLYERAQGNDFCIFTGPIHDREVLRAWNTRADLFLFPSTYDTNGIVVREAAACGLASVLIKDSCAAEGIADGHNGYLIEETADAMSALLEKLCDRMDEMHQVGENAMNEIYISWEDSVHIAYERYGEILEAKRSGLLPDKGKVTTQYFVEATQNIIEGTRDFAQMQKRAWEGMLDNVEEFYEEIKKWF